jgi:hypothetical protein
MRDIKKRYFLTPPLTEADCSRLKTPRQHLHGKRNPTTQLLYGNYWHELGVKMIYVTGTAAAPANKGFRIWYSVVAPGKTHPANPDDLRTSFFTKRKKDVCSYCLEF